MEKDENGVEARLKFSIRKKRLLGATVLCVVLMVGLTVFVAPAYSSSITDFGYSKEFTVSSAVGAGTDYQVKLIVHYGSGADGGNVVYLDGNCRNDFGDVRFVGSDGSTFLSYWMENMYPGDYATFWVKINDDLSSSSSTNYIYYGNSGYSSASDGVATFILFDDFDGDSLDSTLWEPYGAIGVEGYADLSVSDGKIHIWGPNGQPSGILSKSEFLYNVRVHALACTTGAPDEGMVGFQDKANQNHAFVGSSSRYWPVYISSNRLEGTSSNVYSTNTGGYIIVDSNFHIFDEVMLSSSHTFSFIDGILIVNNDKVPTAPLSATLTIWSDGDVVADYFAVTKYVDPEPQVSFQSETEPSPPEVLPLEVPLTGWVVNSPLTNAAYSLSSTESGLLLGLDAVDTTSQVMIYSSNVPSSDLGCYDHLDVSVTGTSNAMIFLRFFLDDGSGFDVVHWDDVATLAVVSFDLSAYAGRTVTVVYIALVSSDGLDASIDVTQIALVARQYSLAVNTVGGGSVVRVPDQASYHLNDVVQLSATPDAGWSFSGWSGSLTGSTNPASLTITGDVSVTATFAQNQYALSFTENGLPPGTQWSATLGGTTLSSTLDSIIFNVPYGTYSWSVTNPIAGSAHIRYLTATPLGTIDVAEQTSISTTYATQYQVSFAATPTKAGKTNPSGTNVWITAGSIQISATANSGYIFNQWSTSTSSITIDDAKSATATATVNGLGTVTANFVTAPPPTFTVTLQSNLPSGTAWSITLNGVKQTSTTNIITFNIAAGTYSWSASNPVPGGTGTRYVTSTPSGRITVAGATTKQIQYRTQYYLTMQVQPAGAGSTSPKSGWYDAGTTIAISATAKKGYLFSSWIGAGTGAYTGTSARSSVIMDGPITEIATFTIKQGSPK